MRALRIALGCCLVVVGGLCLAAPIHAEGMSEGQRAAIEQACLEGRYEDLDRLVVGPIAPQDALPFLVRDLDWRPAPPSPALDALRIATLAAGGLPAQRITWLETEATKRGPWPMPTDAATDRWPYVSLLVADRAYRDGGGDDPHASPIGRHLERVGPAQPNEDPRLWWLRFVHDQAVRHATGEAETPDSIAAATEARRLRQRNELLGLVALLVLLACAAARAWRLPAPGIAGSATRSP